MTEVVLLNQTDDGPESRVVVTYAKRGDRCLLPARMIGYAPNGDLLVEVEHLDTRGGHVFKRTARRISAADLVRVEPVT